jgi:hypothetical protein
MLSILAPSVVAQTRGQTELVSEGARVGVSMHASFHALVWQQQRERARVGEGERR